MIYVWPCCIYMRLVGFSNCLNGQLDILMVLQSKLYGKRVASKKKLICKLLTSSRWLTILSGFGCFRMPCSCYNSPHSVAVLNRERGRPYSTQRKSAEGCLRRLGTERSPPTPFVPTNLSFRKKRNALFIITFNNEIVVTAGHDKKVDAVS